MCGNTVNIDSSNTQRTRFGETTIGNCIMFTIDGQENLRLMYEKMRQAKSSIYIANYDLDPDLSLVRGDLQSFHIFDLVASPCRSESLITTNNSDNDNGPNNNNRNNDKYHSLQDLLIEKARQKVDIKILVWEPRLIIRKLPGIKKRGLEGREKKIEVIKQLAKDYDLEHRISIRLDSKAPTSTSGFHEKITIIDNQIGFCGGQDFSKDKWDTSDHDFDNTLRDKGGEPWHDVHAMVKGPIVWDLIYHFNQRWVYSIWKDIQQVKKIVNASSMGAYLSSSFPYSHLAALSSTNDGDVEITALRTWKRMDEKNDTNTEGGNSIQSWYDSMFKRAKHSIYIEDQFLFQDKAITQILVNRLREEEDLKIITVGPMEPNLPGFIFSVIAKESINDINYNLTSLRKAGKNRVRTYSLISQHHRFKERRKQIYVHSKLMIVDDKWITIGSANTDRDGFSDSTEFDLSVVSTTLAQEVRVKLWREHLKIDAQSSSNSNLYDFDDGFKAWEQLADDNGKRIRNNEAIRGHVYYYNFEEMNCPPPYPAAKGGNRFRLV
jgi:phosphatidylserine/phosphatidylglycerophosphate/cardiolipin synthase-like enzyme